METFLIPTQKRISDLSFSVGKIFEVLSVERCAMAMGCDIKTAYSYKHDQVIPTKRLLNLLVYSHDTGDPLAVEHGRRIVSVFAEAAGCKAVSTALIGHVNQLAAAINNGGEIRELGKGCPACGGELALRGYHDAEPVYGCSKCHGVGLRK